ncbi:MAG: hypothetical protein L0H41_07255 [Microlunatus sp.]|nr:hypothetical protein [Microlunatus sp.]MDN5769688.1 hypothetical protein [Microlunatus sp.]
MPNRAVRLVVGVVAVAMALITGTPSASAEEPNDPDATTSVAARTGLDVSWPQCGDVLPSEMSYAIIGVNGGTAASTNPCLAEQLTWAFDTTTGADPEQPRVQLYVNTANPGQVLEEYQVTTWPTDNLDSRGTDSSARPDVTHRNPYGSCAITPRAYNGYTNDLACSWQYGWNRAVESVDQRFAPAARAAGVSAAAADYRWWLDVETMNSWQRNGAEAFRRNTAALEGMTQFYRSEGVTEVGLYSTHYQWYRIVGDTLTGTDGAGHTTGSNLRGALTWLAGAVDATSAQARCSTLTGLTGGPVVLYQYIADDLDHNYSCG